MRQAPRVTIDDDLDTIAERYADEREASGPAAARRLRDDLIDRMLPFAQRLSHRYRNSGELVDDLEQVAYLGLVKAVDRYDPERGSFTAFAVTTIGGELKRHFRDRTWGVRVPRRLQQLVMDMQLAEPTLRRELGRPPSDEELARWCDVEVADLVEARLSAAGYRPTSLSLPIGDSGRSLVDVLGATDPAFDQVADYMAVSRLVQRLPSRVCRMLAMRFYEDRTQAEIAVELGVSQMQVSRLLARALGWLREALLSDAVPRWPGNDADPADIRIVIRRIRVGVVEAQAVGEVDRDNAARLRELLLATVGRMSAGGRLVVDLAGVPLLDAAGVSVLLGVAEAAQAHEVAMVVTGMRPFVRRIAEIAGLRALVEPADDGPHSI